MKQRRGAEVTAGILDDLFHGCAWAAFIEVARERQGWPDSKAVKARAYEIYEAELAAKNTRPSVD